jgi:hypothetical protein
VDWVPFLIVGAGELHPNFKMIPRCDYTFLALDFRKWIGGEAKIFDYCHKLALEGGKRMAQTFGTQVMDPNGEFTLNMVRRLFFCPLRDTNVLIPSTIGQRRVAVPREHSLEHKD